ncbi:MAG: GAF domain-containing protein [Chloroflexi bacterium]|nr:MAG: GAF domain-containing protein [Chloroflexota bacterium]
MSELPTWRELLASLVADVRERRRIADALDLHPVTLMRWVKGESVPRPQSLWKLLAILPAKHRDMLSVALLEEFGDLSQAMSGASVEDASVIPTAFYARVLHTRANIPPALRFSSLGDLILHQARDLLDPYGLGLAIIVVRCMPPSADDKIHSLRESIGRGNAPWGTYLEQQAMLLGAESLAGYAVMSGHLCVNQDLAHQSSTSLGYRSTWEESAMAVPIMRASKVAGSLLVSSTQTNYFSPARIELVKSYTDLIALAFEDEDFYELHTIELRVMPSLEQQQPYLAGFQRRVAQVIRQAASAKKTITLVQAEQIVWQQLEQTLLSLHYKQ